MCSRQSESVFAAGKIQEAVPAGKRSGRDLRDSSGYEPFMDSSPPNPRLTQFASDNTAGICPEAWKALEEVNEGFAPSYGEDTWTRQAADAIRDVFETDCEVFFCFNGTAANSMSLAHVCRPYHGVIAAETAHVEHDECGGPEFFSHGSKLLLGKAHEGKLSVEAVEEIVGRRADIHYPKPRVVTLTQATEWGTCYSVDEIARLGEACQRLGLILHMDGARFANAVAALTVTPKELTWKLGVDVLCLGGTKNGMPVGEAVVFFDRALAREFDYRCKQAGQLASKMRFVSGPWAEMLRTGTWLRHAAHANRIAALLGRGLETCPGVRLARPPIVNSVFAALDAPVAARLRAAGVAFYDRIDGNARLMCNWSTREADVAEVVRIARGET